MAQSDSSTEFCGKACDHGSPCLLYADHQPPDRHETQHGCIFYDTVPTQVGGRAQRARLAPASPPDANTKEDHHG